MPRTAAADSLGGPVLRDGPANGLSTAEGPFGRTDGQSYTDFSHCSRGCTTYVFRLKVSCIDLTKYFPSPRPAGHAVDFSTAYYCSVRAAELP